MASRSKTPPPPPRPTLTRPLAEAQKLIDERLDRGRALAGERPSQWTELDNFYNEMRKWQEYTHDLLDVLIMPNTIAREFQTAGFQTKAARNEAEVKADCIDQFLSRQLPKLESIRERLALFEAPSEGPVITEMVDLPARSANRKVFIVHGHDGAALHETARFIAQLGLEPVILAEQANRGQTIIEKFIANSNVGFAVVLLTGDDVGAAKADQVNLKARARQNVILELGYFIGSLGRAHVCALHEEGVEIPSDYHGVVWVPLDKNGAWKLLLAKELKAVRFEVDLNRAI